MDEYSSLQEPVCLSLGFSQVCNVSKLKGIFILGPNVFFEQDSKRFYFPDSHMIGELSRFGFRQNSDTFRYPVSSQEIIFIERAIFIGSGVDFLFYESLVYTLAKIWFVASYEPAGRDLHFVLNENMAKSSRHFFSQYLLREFPFSKVSLASSSYIIKVANLSVVSISGAHVYSELHTTRNLALMISKNYSEKAESYDRIFLMRKTNLNHNLNWRKPINSVVVEFTARLLGYKLIDPGRISLEQAMNLFSQAKKVVSYHGGGLTNILFSPPGTKVVELHSDWMNDCFKEISSIGSLDYENMFFRMRIYKIIIPSRIAVILGIEAVKEFRFWYVSISKVFSIFR